MSSIQNNQLEPASTGGSSSAKFLFRAANHFLNNGISTIFVIPNSTVRSISDLRNLTWLEYQQEVNWISALFVLFNFAMISLGLAFTWRQKNLAGLFPLMFFVVYNLSSSLVGFSGQRFILPIDWIGYFYFFSGITWLIGFLFHAAGWDPIHRLPGLINSEPEVGGTPAIYPSSMKTKSGLVVYLMIGFTITLSLLLPVEKGLINIKQPRLDQDQTRAEILNIASRSMTDNQYTRLAAFLDQPETAVFDGLALYPREIPSETEAGGILRYAGEAEYPVLSFLHIGDERHWVLLTLPAMIPISLPHASETMVAGSWIDGRFGEKSIQAVIVIPTDSQEIYFSEEILGKD